MVDMTLIRPVNEGQGHSFWHQSISHVRLSINSNFCSRTHRLATIHSVQTDFSVQTDDDRRTQHCTNSIKRSKIVFCLLLNNAAPLSIAWHNDPRTLLHNCQTLVVVELFPIDGAEVFDRGPFKSSFNLDCDILFARGHRVYGTT